MISMSQSPPRNLSIILITLTRFYLLYKPFLLILKCNQLLHRYLFLFFIFVYFIRCFNIRQLSINSRYLSIWILILSDSLLLILEIMFSGSEYGFPFPVYLFFMLFPNEVFLTHLLARLSGYLFIFSSI
jgi:hypothetical protein